MAQDAYSPCPCGSGKKLKFCCGEFLPELQRAERLVDNQPDAAETILRGLLDKYPDKDAIISLLADLLQRAGRLSEVRELLIAHLRRQPDHPQALLGLAELCLIEDGFEASRRIVHRGFQLCARNNPNAVALLAQRIARELMPSGCFLAVREHLAMAVRHAQGDVRTQTMMLLAQFEASRDIAFPSRGSNPLLPVEGAVATQEQDQRARKLCMLGCFEPAAIIYARLTESDPQDGALWHNLGLCSVWDARHADAIPALRKAASLLEDRDQAAESEALAQLLEEELSDDKYSQVMLSLQIASVSEVLSRLDDDPSVHRVTRQPEEEDDSLRPVAARYDILSRALTEQDSSNPVTLPEIIGELAVYDAIDADDDEDSPVLEIAALEDDVAAAVVRVRSIVGDLVTTMSDQEKPITGIEGPAEQLLFDHALFKPPGLSEKAFREIRRAQFDEAVNTWLNRPHTALGGTTPREAAADPDPERQTALRAAIMNLHAWTLRTILPVEVSAVLQQLGLPAAAPVALAENAQVAAIPGYRFFRITVDKLTDQQLADLANRTIMLGFAETTKHCLDVLMQRPESRKILGERRAAVTRAVLARDDGDYERAFECYDLAREWVATESDAFRHVLEIDVRELACRLDDPKDPGIVKLLHKFRDKYLRKIPEISDIVRSQLEESGCGHLASELDLESSVGSLVLTGDKSATEPKSESKLWLPGQD
jgi:tetratricopeptide (TPR) repeat protein